MGGNGPWSGGGVNVGAASSSSWTSSISNRIDQTRLDDSDTFSPPSLPTVPSTSSSSSPAYSPSLSPISADFSTSLSANSMKILPAFIAGTFSFYSTMALSTLLQKKVLRISTGTLPPIPTMAGLASVAACGLVAHGSSVVTMSLQTNCLHGSARHVPWSPEVNIGHAADILQSGVQHIRHDIDNLADTFASNPFHVLRIATLALVTFKLLGGRFWAISPSSYTNLGSFGRVSHSLRATMGYATPSQRRIIEAVGRQWGCHTCGSRMILSRTKNGIRFHADHMPPRSVADRLNSKLWRRLLRIKVKQRFYPQCVHCSNVQGGILSKAMPSGGLSIGARRLANYGTALAAYNHGLRPRIYHVTGGAVAVATVWDADEQKVVTNGNANRFANVQGMIQHQVGAFAEIWNDLFG